MSDTNNYELLKLQGELLTFLDRKAKKITPVDIQLDMKSAHDMELLIVQDILKNKGELPEISDKVWNAVSPRHRTLYLMALAGAAQKCGTIATIMLSKQPDPNAN